MEVLMCVVLVISYHGGVEEHGEEREVQIPRPFISEIEQLMAQLGFPVLTENCSQSDRFF